MSAKTKITKQAQKINIEFIAMAVLFLVLIFPIILATHNYLKIGTAPYIVAGTALLSLGFLSIPFILFKQKIAFLISAIFVLLSPLEIIHLILYKESVTSGFLLLAFQTDFNEIWELIYFNKFLSIMYILIAAIYIFSTLKWIKNRFLLKKTLRLIGLITFVFFISALYAYSFKSEFKRDKPTTTNFKDANDAFFFKFRKIYPTNIFVATHKAYHFYQDIFNVNPEILNFYFDAAKKDSIPEREIYVLVIGETARYHNFSIHGYERETTPLLAQTQDLISYEDVYTLANLTSISVPLLITRANPLNFNITQQEKTVADAFKEAGFDSYWIANQSTENSYLRSVANRTNQAFFSIKDGDSVNNFDEDLWKSLEEIFQKEEKKQFIILHTLGSHFRYNLRYPENFRKFMPDLEGMTDYSLIGKSLKEKLVNSYDNSILYTDYFLANTIKKLNEQDAVSYLMYVSDHGENLYDDEKDYVLHGSARPSEIEVHIPFLVWTSEKYQAYYHAKQHAIADNKDKKLSADVVFYSLLDMANIDIPGENYEQSIANPLLVEDSVRYVLNPQKEVLVFQ